MLHRGMIWGSRPATVNTGLAPEKAVPKQTVPRYATGMKILFGEKIKMESTTPRPSLDKPSPILRTQTNNCFGDSEL